MSAGVFRTLWHLVAVVEVEVGVSGYLLILSLLGCAVTRAGGADAVWRPDGVCAAGAEWMWEGQEGGHRWHRRPGPLCRPVRRSTGCRGVGHIPLTAQAEGLPRGNVPRCFVEMYFGS